MKTLKIDINCPDSRIVKETVKVLQNGGVVLAPSDTCYGLMADITNKKAIESIFEIKGRDFNKPLSIAVNYSFYDNYVELNEIQREIFENLIPGRYTVILPKSKLVPSNIVSGSKFVGIRVMDFQFIRDVLDQFKLAIITTSANSSGRPPKYSAKEVLDEIDENMIDLTIDGGNIPLNTPSRVVKIHDDGKEEIFRK